jgi:hypothetical protein
MEYEIHLHDDGFFEVVTHGDGDVEVFQKLLRDALEHSDWKPGMPVLVDHSDFNAGPLTAEDMAAIAGMINAARDKLGSSRMAILAPGDLQFALGRMWQAYLENKWDGTTDIFRSRQNALRWLTQP